MSKGGLMQLKDLEYYQLSREISLYVWNIYRDFDWQTKKIIGDQWIRSTDSVSANIAEAYGRFHYLDKNKFYYNARGSLYETLDWTEKLCERAMINEEQKQYILSTLLTVKWKLNAQIKRTKQQKNME